MGPTEFFFQKDFWPQKNLGLVILSMEIFLFQPHHANLDTGRDIYTDNWQQYSDHYFRHYLFPPPSMVLIERFLKWKNLFS